MTFDDFIKELGGYTEVARELGHPLSTVHSWKRRGNLPRWQRSALADLASRKGVLMPDAFAEQVASPCE